VTPSPVIKDLKIKGPSSVLKSEPGARHSVVDVDHDMTASSGVAKWAESHS